MTKTVFINKNRRMPSKIWNNKSFPADFALESVTNKAPGLRDSKTLVPGLMTIY
jgi:hypothetical protein